MLNFSGIGSAFNTDLGNNSAFIKEGNRLLLIDCGGAVFGRIKQMSVLENVKHIVVLITHTHPDHIGSLGELIFYSHYILGLKPKIFFPHASMVTDLLRIMGVKGELYELSTETDILLTDPWDQALKIGYHPASHTESIPAYGLLLTWGNRSIYYSGDANKIEPWVVDGLEKGLIIRIYQDTCGADYEGNPHMSLNHLITTIPVKLRDRVFCMHLDSHFSREEAQRQGFQVVGVYSPE